MTSRLRSVLAAVRSVLPGGVDSAISQTFELLRDTYVSWRRSRTIRLGAGLAYYALFAIVPLLTIALALVEFLFSKEDVQSQVARRLESVFGEEAEQVAALFADQVGETSVQSGLGLIGGISLLLTGVVLFVALQDALNTIWNASITGGMGSTIRRYALGFAVVLLLVAVMIGSIAVQAISGLLETLAGDDTTVLEPLISLAEVLGSWALGCAAVVVVFHLLSPREVSWRHATIGGAITSVGLLVGTWVIGWYLSHYGGASLAGAAGSLALIFVWIYYEAQILLAGAVLTRVLSERGRRDASRLEESPAIAE